MMRQYTMHLLGQDIDVKMNMQVLIGYEEITGRSFYGEDFSTMKSRYALLAAVLAASGASEDISERLLTDVTPKDFSSAFDVMVQALADFFEIPSVLTTDEVNAEEEPSKN